MKAILLFAGVVGTVLARQPTATATERTVRPEACAQTEPVPHPRDAADDPAIWIHPEKPELSLILGTDKRGGLHSYNMDGSLRELVAEGSNPNNVDVLYCFNLNEHTVDLAVATVRAKEAMGVKVWTIDPATRRLLEVTDGETIQVVGGQTPSGICGYRSVRTGRFFCFVTREGGQVDQVELTATAGGKMKGTNVRTLKAGSHVEGCVADDERGFVYLADEKVGIWKFGAEPDAAGEGKLVARVGENGLAADVEGLTIYYASNGGGYLIASSQGNDTFKVYERAGENRFLLTIDPKDGRIDDVSHTDGICVIGCPTSRQFARGVFIAQDGKNAGGNQNFNLYAWEDIAEKNLLIDTTWRPRGTLR